MDRIIETLCHYASITKNILGLEAAKSIPGEKLFGFSDYLATLSLLLIVIAISEFRYRYRLAIHRLNLKRVAFWIAAGVGLLFVLTEIWFDSQWLIPSYLNHENGIRAALALFFLLAVLYFTFASFIKAPAFGRSNANQFFSANWHFIHQGNVDRLQVIAEELSRPINAIFNLAALVPREMGGDNDKGGKSEEIPIEQAVANDMILLLADRRFCRVVVDKVPGFAVQCFQEADQHVRSAIPFASFARNIGQEFIRNTDSSFYQEDSGFESGLFGYTKPVTTFIFGSYRLIEWCASEAACPLDTDYEEVSNFSKLQMEGFARASLAFTKAYLEATGGTVHSYAFFRCLSSMEYAIGGTQKLNNITEGYTARLEIARLQIASKFAGDAIDLLEQFAKKPRHWRTKDTYREDVFDGIAGFAYKLITAAARVQHPESLAWFVQHNTVWSSLIGFGKNSEALSIVALKLRRKMYKAIREMDKSPNFVGTSVLGFCLNIFGLTLVDRHKGYRREFYPLQAAALDWTRKNYRRLVEDHPKLAEDVLHGTITYDAANKRLTKTYGGHFGKDFHIEALTLE